MLDFENAELPRLDRGIYAARHIGGYRGQAAVIRRQKNSSIKSCVIKYQVKHQNVGLFYFGIRTDYTLIFCKIYNSRKS